MSHKAKLLQQEINKHNIKLKISTYVNISWTAAALRKYKAHSGTFAVNITEIFRIINSESVRQRWSHSLYTKDTKNQVLDVKAAMSIQRRQSTLPPTRDTHITARPGHHFMLITLIGKICVWHIWVLRNRRKESSYTRWKSRSPEQENSCLLCGKSDAYN